MAASKSQAHPTIKQRPANIDGKELLDWMRSQCRLDPDTDCHIWTKSKNPQGYGWIRYRGKSLRAHRLAFHLTHPENLSIHDSIHVLHRCDTPACINPEHLFLGTNDDNVQDMMEKGRQQKRSGENGSRAMLTQEQVNEIRNAVRSGTETQKQIGKRFAVTQQTISDIVNFRSWKTDDRRS